MSAPSPERQEAVPPGGASVLIVDDRRANLIALEALLRPLGRRIVAAESGEDALRHLLAEDFALILLDVQMPGMDGFETAGYVRARPRSRHVPIIFVTAISTAAEHVFAGYEAGAVDYILKPINAVVLRSKVSVFLELFEANVRLRRETELRAAHESLALAQRSGMSGVWDWDIAGRRIYWSAEYGELCGLGPDVADREDAWLDVVHPSERERLSRRLERLFESGDAWDEDYRIVHADRGIRWLSARGRLYRDATGAPERFTGIAFDVTDRKLAETRAGRLHEITAALSAATSSAEMVGLVLSQAPVAAGARSATLWSPERTDLPPGASLPVEVEPHARRVVREGIEVLAVDDGRLVLLTLTAGVGPAAVLCLDYGRPTSRDDDARDFLAGLGAHCAQALERARLYDAQRRARERARFSADASLALDAADLGVRQRLSGLSEMLVPRLADVCVIDLETDGQIATVSVRALSREAEETFVELRRRSRGTPGPDTIEKVLRSAEPFFLAHLDPSDLEARIAAAGVSPALAERVRRHAPSSVLVVPMIVQGSAIGTITLVSLDPGRRFDDDDLRIASDLGRRAGLAIQNARLYEQQAGMAVSLQRSLLPPDLPVMDGVTLAARYLSGAAGTQAGGDWFEAVSLEDKRVVLAVGDVVGRGTDAAAVMGQLRSAMRAYATAGMSPGEILFHLSRLAMDVPGAFASTALCAEIDVAAGRLRYARAGHPPALLIEPSGKTSFLTTNGGTVLGFGSHRHDEITTDLPDGSALVLYTDGAIERRGEGLDQGFERLARTVCSTWPASPSLICDELVARLFADGAPADDVAMLVARTGAPAPLSLRAPADPDQLAQIRRVLREWLKGLPMTQTAREDVVLACGEAATNAVEHGRGAGVGGTMWVDAKWAAGDTLRLSVRDDGVWREPTPSKDGLRGRGLPIMRQIMDEVEISTDDSHTQVTMMLRPESTPRIVMVGSAGQPPGAVTSAPGPASSEILRLAETRVVRLRGEIDATSVPALDGELKGLAAEGGPLTIDMSDVAYFGSEGIALLWALATALERQGDQLQVIAPHGGRARHVLDLSGPGSVDLLDCAPIAET